MELTTSPPPEKEAGVVREEAATCGGGIIGCGVTAVAAPWVPRACRRFKRSCATLAKRGYVGEQRLNRRQLADRQH